MKKRVLILLLLALHSPLSFGAEQIRVVTYNIALGYFMRLEKKVSIRFFKRKVSIAHLLRTHSALKNFDILGVQEICKEKREQQLEYFRNLLRERNLPTYSRFAAANPLSNDRCRRGQMILSRYPIINSGKFKLPLLRPGGKTVLWADIQVPIDNGFEVIRVYNLHLDNRGKSFFAAKGRLKQMKVVLDHYHDWKQSHPEGRAIILGDFNSLNRIYNYCKREAAILETMKYLTPSLRKCKVTNITGHQLDWIFYDNLQLIRSRVAYKIRSDHFPVSADFKL